jgi:hypothetical protein
MSAIDQLRAVRDQLRRQLEANEVFIAWMAADQAVKAAESQMNSGSLDVPDMPDSRPWLPTVISLSSKILMQAGTPLPTEKIYAELIKLGVNFTGQNPIRNTRSALSRSNQFVSVRTEHGPMWWLADRQLPGPVNSSAI